MPKTTVDYSKIVIYKIQHIEKEHLIYVGSTINFKSRKARHKSMAETYNDKHSESFKCVYRTIRENGGWDKFRMTEIKKYPCCDKREAEAEEDRYIRDLKAVLNMRLNVFNDYKRNEESKERKALKDAFDEKVRSEYF